MDLFPKYDELRAIPARGGGIEASVLRRKPGHSQAATSGSRAAR